jgi:hypothetical protein
MPVEIGAARGACDVRPKLLEVTAHRSIGDDRQRGVDLIGVLAPERDLLILGDAAGEQWNQK